MRHQIVFTVSILALPSLAGASDFDPLAELKACARTSDDATRMACYEALGQRALGDESAPAGVPAAVPPPPAPESAPAVPLNDAAVTAAPAPAEAAAAAPTPAEAAPMPEDLGRKKPEKKKENKSYRGQVKSCRQNSDGIWYFTFDDGQVWYQSGRGRYMLDGCNFDVTIRKDFFGYKMEIDGGTTIRVRRQK